MGIHSIIVIKNEKGKYLQYFDDKWNSYLFLNCKLLNENDSDAVVRKIEESFNIDKSKIEVALVGKKTHTKFSESAKLNKEYTHLFFSTKLNIKLSDNEFEQNGIKYKWFSYLELLNDDRIMKVNSDIVNFIKEFKI